MKYIKSRSNFLNEKKHNLILEGGLENNINWGDSLVGRLFMSAFRLGSSGAKNLKLNGLKNSLRDTLYNDTQSAVQEVLSEEDKESYKELTEEINILSKVDGLLDELKKGDIKDIQSYMKSIADEEIEEIVNKLTDSDDSKTTLMKMQEWVPTPKPNTPKPPTGSTASVPPTGSTASVPPTGSTASVPPPKVNVSLYNKMIANLKSLKDMLSKSPKPSKGSTGSEVTYKKGEKVINTTNGKEVEVVFVSYSNKDTEGPDKKLGTKDDKKGNIKLKSDEVYVTSDGSTGEVVKKSNIIKKESLLIENLLMLLEVSFEDNGLYQKSLKNISDGENIEGKLSVIKTGTKLNVKPVSISTLIKKNTEKKHQSLLNTYKIIHKYIKGGSKLSSTDMYNKLMADYLKGRKNKKPGEGTRSRIWRECIVAKKISDLYKSMTKFTDQKRDKKLIEIFKPFMSSMKSVLSEIETMTNESSYILNEAVLSDYFQGDIDKIGLTVMKDKIEEVTFDESDESLVPFKYKYWVNNYLNSEKIISKNVDDLNKKLKKLSDKLDKNIKPKYAINVFEIVKIFRKASRTHTKKNIPSLRTGGTLTRTVANNWEDINGGSVDPERPGQGPFRNIKLYDKWNKIVIDIINEFDYALKPKDSMVRLSKSGELIKPTKSIYDFIIDALEGDKVSSSKSNQLDFLKGYFGEEAKGLAKTPKYPDTEEDNDGIDPKKQMKSAFKESKEINVEKSGLYKLKLSNYYKVGASDFMPKSDELEVYVYVSINGENKFLYLFEDYNNINKFKSGDNTFDEKGVETGVNKKIYITKLSENNIRKSDLANNIKAIELDSKNEVTIKGSSIKIKKIEKVIDIKLGELSKKLTDEIKEKINGFKNPFKNS